MIRREAMIRPRLRQIPSLLIPSLLLAIPFAVAASLASAPAVPANDGGARLPTDVVPTFQAVRLYLDADKSDYTGATRVELRVSKRTDAIRFHAHEINLKRVTLSGSKGSVELKPEAGEGAIVTARAPAPIEPGPYTLTIEFTNEFDTRASGLYRLESGGSAYAFTQFEAIDARKAFPCWDEPIFKFPYQVTLSVPEAHQAVSNTPVEKETVENGLRTVVFAKTMPMPSYLLAIATGPLEFAPIPGLRVPGRVVTPKGSSHLAGVAVNMTPPIFAAVEKFFGTPYPYEKLDLIAVPEYAPGAMENPGAITYADRFLLFDEKTMSATQRRTFAIFTAHEIAHMWFGDLVTMKWWDDLWLNESFAEWTGNRIADEVHPEYMIRLHALTEVQKAFDLDAQLATRAIRQPVKSMENLLQAADVLAYKKGQAVLGMTERWLGPEAFRGGVLAYLKRHAWGNAEAKDLWNALAQASGQDVRGVLASFLDQPGVPVVHAELNANRTVTLSQKRFLRYGVAAPAPQLWKIPITLKWKAGDGTRSKQVLLDRERTTVTLDGGSTPEWIHPNADEGGYYRWSVDPATLERLIAAAPTALNPSERIGFIQNASALLESGGLHGDQYLQILSGFSGEENPLVLSALVASMDAVMEGFVTEPMEDAFAAYVRRVLGPALRRVGLDRAPGEAEAISLVRPALLGWLANEGKDDAALARAEEMVRSFLKDRGSIDPSLVAEVLALSAIRGDEALFEEYRKRFESATAPTDRKPLLTALGNFRDSALRRKALDYALTGPLRPQELLWIPESMAETPRFRDETWAWWQANYEKVVSRMPPDYAIYIPYMAGGCSERRLQQAETFFADPKHSPPGTLKELAKVAEATRDCLGLRAREGEAVARTLAQLAQAK
jgi:alanyl aminopeptidase